MSDQASNHELWHMKPLAEVLQGWETTRQGLGSEEARERLEKYGPNSLPQQEPPAWWQIALRQFQSPLIYILVAAAVVAVAVGDVKDAAFIAAVLVINAGIGGYQEWRAEQSSKALQKLLHIRASVVRDGEVLDLDAEELVPGDVVWLESGNRVPADVRLISSHGLEIDESLLTGESISVSKDAEWQGEAASGVGDRLNLAYAASNVIRGRAKGVVVATSSDTQVGRLAADVTGAAGGRPPLLERMEKFSQTIAYVMLAAILVIGFIGIVFQGYPLKEMFLFGVALAVSAIPEGLPAALTVALSIATSRMARRKVIVRRLAAVEGLGSCTMIASDKTGTLTCNELTVRAVYLADGTELEVTGEGFQPEGEIRRDGQTMALDQSEPLERLIRTGVLCNESELHRHDDDWTWRGDPTDIALLSLGQKAGVGRETLLDRHPQVNEIPFESEHQYSATFHKGESQAMAFVKGAPERVLKMCGVADDPERMRQLEEAAAGLAEQGFRVIALAEGVVDEPLSSDQNPPEPAGLEFLGLVGMIDPLRSEAREAVEKCHRAGIEVCMITGDHPVTALAIARDLGLAQSTEQVLTGSDLAGMSPEELQGAIRRGRVFARVAPRQKLELVEAAQAEGHFVAVTGDGVNDAPALRTANIGVAMGKAGTDVAREAAELVITDDNFATIVAGVEEGRIAYDNIRKVVYLLVSMGAAEVLLIGLAFSAGSLLPLALLPVQLLWLNLVTNGIQGVALAFDPAEEGILRRQPRLPSEPIFNRLMIERTLVAAAVMAGVGLTAFWWMIDQGWSEGSARNALLLYLVLSENFHIGNCRSETRSAFQVSPLRSPFLLWGAVLAFSIHLVAMHVPFLQRVLRTEGVSATTWGVMVGLALLIVVALEIHKWTWRLRGHAHEEAR